MSKMIKEKIYANGLTIDIYTSDFQNEYISLTDIAKQNDKLYIQITKEIKSEKTEKREYHRLLEVSDNYPKYLLTTDDFAGGNYQGIKTMHIADFLLSNEYYAFGEQYTLKRLAVVPYFFYIVTENIDTFRQVLLGDT